MVVSLHPSPFPLRSVAPLPALPDVFLRVSTRGSGSKPLCDFRLGTVVTSDHETPLTENVWRVGVGRRASGFFGTAMTCAFEGLRLLEADNAVKSGDWANYMIVLFGNGKVSVWARSENATLSNEVGREDEDVVCGMWRPVQSVRSEQSLGHTRQQDCREAKVFRAHAAPKGVCGNLVNALKLLANQQRHLVRGRVFRMCYFFAQKTWRSTALAVDRADHDGNGANQRARHVHGDPDCLVLVHNEHCDGL